MKNLHSLTFTQIYLIRRVYGRLEEDIALVNNIYALLIEEEKVLDIKSNRIIPPMKKRIAEDSAVIYKNLAVIAKEMNAIIRLQKKKNKIARQKKK